MASLIHSARLVLSSPLPSPLEALEIDSIYLAHDKRHSHILFEYGDPTAQLVIVVSHDPETQIDAVLGHYFLDISEDCYAAP